MSIFGQGSPLNVLVKVADYTIVPKDLGSLVTTRGATADVEFTLPSITELQAGFHIWFFNAADFEMLITAPEGDVIATLNNAAADGLSWTDASTQLGGGVLLIFDGALWNAFAALGGTTLTVISA